MKESLYALRMTVVFMELPPLRSDPTREHSPTNSGQDSGSWRTLAEAEWNLKQIC